MTNQELATCAINDISDQGRRHQQRHLGWCANGSRCSTTKALLEHRPANKSDSGLREAGGCVWLSRLALRVPAKVDATIEKAMSLNDAPVVIDFQVLGRHGVANGSGAGTSNDMITIARSLAPAWERED